MEPQLTVRTTLPSAPALASYHAAAVQRKFRYINQLYREPLTDPAGAAQLIDPAQRVALIIDRGHTCNRRFTSTDDILYQKFS